MHLHHSDYTIVLDEFFDNHHLCLIFGKLETYVLHCQFLLDKYIGLNVIKVHIFTDTLAFTLTDDRHTVL